MTLFVLCNVVRNYRMCFCPIFILYTSFLLCNVSNHDRVVGPCHHGMARPQVADRGTASDMEGSCE